MKRITIAALGLLVGSTTGCIDMGLDGNVPLEEAEHREPRPLVAAVHQQAEAAPARVIVDGRLWIPAGRPLTAEPGTLSAVGSADGRTVYARRWDRPPFDMLLMEAASPAEGRYLELQPVRGRSGPVPGSEGAPQPGGQPAAPGAH